VAGVIGQLLDTLATFFRTREQERRWVNADRGDRRPIYAPPIVRHHRPWPGQQRGRGGPRPYQPWPGDHR
jgi:hypothetical protein